MNLFATVFNPANDQEIKKFHFDNNEHRVAFCDGFQLSRGQWRDFKIMKEDKAPLDPSHEDYDEDDNEISYLVVFYQGPTPTEDDQSIRFHDPNERDWFYDGARTFYEEFPNYKIKYNYDD